MFENQRDVFSVRDEFCETKCTDLGYTTIHKVSGWSVSFTTKICILEYQTNIITNATGV